VIMKPISELQGVLQHDAWGSTTSIAQLLGLEQSDEPDAELWFGAHTSAPSTIGSEPLDALITADPAVAGTSSVDRFGPKLSYLLKLLAAARPLSIQAHPSRAQAEEGFAREDRAGLPRDAPDRNYADDWPKPEMLVALEPTEALCGFRSPAETADLLAGLHLPELDARTAALRDADQPAGLREVFTGFLSMGTDGRQLVDAVVARASQSHGVDAFGQLCATAVETASFFPGDPGVLAAMLMNRISLQRFDGVFLPAGNLHAYLSGFGVEIMANSDNVLRGGLTPRHIDVAELDRVVDFSPGFHGLARTVEERPGVVRYQTPAPEFALWRLEGPSALPAEHSGRIVLAIEPVRLRSSEGELGLPPGHAAFVPAHAAVQIDPDGAAFMAAPGVDVVG